MFLKVSLRICYFRGMITVLLRICLHKKSAFEIVNFLYPTGGDIHGRKGKEGVYLCHFPAFY